MLCKNYFVRIVVDLFVGPFNCLNFSLELCVCVCVCVCARARAGTCVRACVRACVRVFVRVCMRECMCVCLFLSLLFFFFFLSPNIVNFCYVYKLFLLKTVLFIISTITVLE